MITKYQRSADRGSMFWLCCSSLCLRHSSHVPLNCSASPSRKNLSVTCCRISRLSHSISTNLKPDSECEATSFIMSRLHHRLTFPPFLCLCSGSTGLEEEKALREAAGSDRRYAVHHRVPEGGARERQHQHRSAEEHGLRCKGHEGCARKHVRDVEGRVRLLCCCWGFWDLKMSGLFLSLPFYYHPSKWSIISLYTETFLYICTHVHVLSPSLWPLTGTSTK